MVAIPHRWLSDTLTSLLQTLPAEVIPLYPEQALPALPPAVDLLVLDPFSFGHAGLECFLELRCRLDVPVVVLLPADTCDYRAAADNLGADAIVVAENADPELLQIVRGLLGEGAPS